MRRTALFVTILVLVLAVALSACSQTVTNVPELRESVTVDYDTATAEYGDVLSVISYDAYVCATLEDVYFEKETGTLGEVYVGLGDRVEAGDTLAVLDCTAYDAAIENAQSAYNTRNSTLKSDVRKAEINVELAQLDLNAARESGDEQAIAAAELEVERLENEVTQIEEMGALELGKLQQDIADAKSELDGTVLTAPCSGEVVLLNVTTAGTRVTSETAILRIADDSRMVVQYDGSESISNSDLEQKRITAIVGGGEYKLDPVLYEQAEYTRMLLAGERPPVRFTFAEPVEAVPGDFTEVLIYNSEARGVLRIPVNALYTAESGVTYVYIVDGEQKIYTEVSVGVRSESFIEITSGLEEGDVVFVKQ